MSTATTARPSPRTPWSSYSQSRPHKRPTHALGASSTRSPASATPHAQSTSLSHKTRSPSRVPGSPGPSYFEFVSDPSTSNPVDSDAGGHAKSNWSPPTSAVQSAGLKSPSALPTGGNEEFEAFRKQSETNAFTLGHGNLSHFSISGDGSRQLPTQGLFTRHGGGTASEDTKSAPIAIPGSAADSGPMDVDSLSASSPRSLGKTVEPSVFDLPRQESPANVALPNPLNPRRNQLSNIDDRHPRLSLPTNPIIPEVSLGRRAQRAETLPAALDEDGPSMVNAQSLADLMKNSPIEDFLLLDLRVFPQYSASRIRGAMNLCIPTTLLKRPSFNVQKLASTFTKEEEKARFARWKQSKYIVVYDACSVQMKDAVSSNNTVKKFTKEGWEGTAWVIRGGFLEFQRLFPELIDRRSSNEMQDQSMNKLSIDPALPDIAPVAGGCPMPSTQNAANPFFGTIRQNMDLIGGVGQMAIKYPSSLSGMDQLEFPEWIRRAANLDNKGKAVADRFLAIEQTEQQRMQKALSGNVRYGTPGPSSARALQIAGIEKGTKNRYKDMLPYDHSRVRLQNVPTGECDYINASHIKAEWSNKHYIASQAPVPATFEDFWRVVWEQDVRVIVMLTAEHEGGQRKSHPYWTPASLGPFKLKAISEKRVSLETSPRQSPSNFSPSSSKQRPAAGRRRSTNPNLTKNSPDHDVGDSIARNERTHSIETPHIIIRKLTLSHSTLPFQPIREITQLHYSSWPDFGAPADSAHVLRLIEQCDAIVRSSGVRHAGSPKEGAWNADEPQPQGQRPVVVHCSAGCGRTGTFCTIDSVLDMFKRQKAAAVAKGTSPAIGDESADRMDVDGGLVGNESDWVKRDDVDLIAKTVEDFRVQRLSMVQTLRQFVLCYETVLEWIARERGRRQASVSYS